MGDVARAYLRAAGALTFVLAILPNTRLKLGRPSSGFGKLWSASASLESWAPLLLLLVVACHSANRSSASQTTLDSNRVLTLGFSALMNRREQGKVPSSYCLAIVSPSAQADPPPAVLEAVESHSVPVLPFSRCSNILQSSQPHDTTVVILIWPSTPAETTLGLRYKRLLGPYRGVQGECSFSRLAQTWAITRCTSEAITPPDTTFHCLPESAFALGPARIGEMGTAAIPRLGHPLTITHDTVEGADNLFPVIRYRYADFELTVSQSSGRVAEIRALTGELRTPLGFHLGMAREELERRSPARAFRTPIERSNENALEAYSCGSSVASTTWLAFDSLGRLSELILQGFYLEQ
jgi:hypothetical protein